MVRNRPSRKIRSPYSRFRRSPFCRGALGFDLLVVLLETLSREGAARRRARLALPGDGPDLVVAFLVAPGPVKPGPASHSRLVGILVAVELEAFRRAHQVQALIALPVRGLRHPSYLC